jgi:hypothetical protein
MSCFGKASRSWYLCQIRGWKHGKVCQKIYSHMYSQPHLWHKHEKTYSIFFLNSLWSNGALHWIYNKLHIKCEEFSYKKNGWKICSKLIGFSEFPHTFIWELLINYDYDMKCCKTHWYILMLYPFESIKNSVTIVLSSYFHILEIGAWHLLSYTYIFKNVFKCILKHAIIQFYATKSKIFLLLIVKVKKFMSSIY